LEPRGGGSRERAPWARSARVHRRYGFQKGAPSGKKSSPDTPTNQKKYPSEKKYFEGIAPCLDPKRK